MKHVMYYIHFIYENKSKFVYCGCVTIIIIAKLIKMKYSFKDLFIGILNTIITEFRYHRRYECSLIELEQNLIYAVTRLMMQQN